MTFLILLVEISNRCQYKTLKQGRPSAFQILIYPSQITFQTQWTLQTSTTERESLNNLRHIP